MLVRRKSAWSVEMLAVLVVLVALVPTWSDGLLLTKCDLKSQLEAALSNLQVENAADIIAKLACTVENISGFNTNLVNNIDQFDPGTLIIAPFLDFNDEDYPSGMGELPLTTNTVSNDYGFPESTEGTEEPSTPLQVVGEDKFTLGQDEESVDVDAQARKQREAPSEDEGDGSGAALIDDGDILHATVESHRLPDPTDVDNETYEMLFGPRDLPPDSTAEPKDIPYDDYETLFGLKGLPPDSSSEPKDIPYDDYETLFGPKGLPPDSTAEPKDIPYDDYETLFGPKGLPPDSTAEPKDPLDIPLNTTGPLETETKKRSKRSSEDQTLLYGIFQLSDVTCNSGSSYSLDLCQLNCSALTDDDITDDIACLMGLGEKMVRMMFLQECLSVEPSDYFAECG